MLKYEKFGDLMQRADVLALADRLCADGSPADFSYKFMALSMMCVPVLPENDLPEGYACTGACVFYAPQDDDGFTGGYVAWMFQVGLGASAWYTFTKGDDATQLMNEDDSGDPWQQRTMELLAGSFWLPLHDPATLGL